MTTPSIPATLRNGTPPAKTPAPRAGDQTDAATMTAELRLLTAAVTEGRVVCTELETLARAAIVFALASGVPTCDLLIAAIEPRVDELTDQLLHGIRDAVNREAGRRGWDD